MEHTINTLIAQFSLVEKVSLLAGVDMWSTRPVPRLGIPAIRVTDGPNGARGADDNLGSTSMCFPVGVAMGATWNPDLIRRVGMKLAAEARAKGGHVLLAPTVNIHRTPNAGRNFECFAEDPYLSGVTAAAYINGLQSQGVAACIKHFVCNDQEFERQSISAEVTERPLREIYLEPFRIAVQRANPWSIMSAYNRVNGVFASENDITLRDILKGEWNYDGLVISDWYGTYTEAVPAGGLDLEMPGPARWMNPEKIIALVVLGRLDETVIDDKVRRLLRLMERVGAFAPAQPAVQAVDRPEDRQLARAVAAEAIVLLKNEQQLLPINLAEVKTIAVIGENAKWAQIMGGGSAAINPHYVVSPLAGIQARVGEAAQVVYAIGCPIHQMPPLLDPAWLTAADGTSRGLTLTYFDNLTLSGMPTHTAVVQKSALSWFGMVNPYVDPANFSLRLSGTLTVPESRVYELHLASIGHSRLLLDGVVQLDSEERANVNDGQSMQQVSLLLEAERPYQLVVEYATLPQARWRMLQLSCLPELPADPIQVAVDLAAQADVAIVVAGLTKEWESEGFDRPDLHLVGRQDELIARVAAVNPRTVVVLNVGSPVVMPWLETVPAALQQWYGGQEAGNALADVLFGDVNPSGKLPTTFPQRMQDNPAYINYPGENGKVQYGEGIFVGYRYYDKKGIAPLFPFGHGLSYTTFAYDHLRLNSDRFSPGDEIVVSVDVTNTGARMGQEVVQVYVRDVEARLARPLQELKAFAKVALEPGETKTVTLHLNRQSLAFYDPAAPGWVTEPGEFEVLVGRSSRDICLRVGFTWGGERDALHTGLTLAALLADDRGAAVLQAHLGDLLHHPQASMALSMTLNQIAAFAPELLTEVKMAAINDALAAAAKN